MRCIVRIAHLFGLVAVLGLSACSGARLQSRGDDHTQALYNNDRLIELATAWQAMSAEMSTSPGENLAGPFSFPPGLPPGHPHGPPPGHPHGPPPGHPCPPGPHNPPHGPPCPPPGGHGPHGHP